MELYRRHTPNCKQKAKGKTANCTCPIYADGILDGKRFRRSMLTNNWSLAEERAGLVKNAKPEERAEIYAPKVPLLSEALAALQQEQMRLKFGGGTIAHYESKLNSLIAFTKDVTVDKITSDTITDWIGSRHGGGNTKKTEQTIALSTQRQEIGMLRCFFRFCIAKKWLATNPAIDVKKPKEKKLATLPFEDDELARILRAAESSTAPHADEIRALVYTMLCTGFRISDVALLSHNAFKPNRVIDIICLKNKVRVVLQVNAAAINTIAALPPNSDGRVFRVNGLARLDSRTTTIGTWLRKLGKRAGVENVHPHRFRDTFAVGMLRGGASLRTLQHALGHTSIITTEKHYARFIPEEQELLNRATAALQFGQESSRPFLVHAS